MKNDSHLLLEAGYAPLDDGVQLSGNARELYERWTKLLAELLKPYYDQAFLAPLFIKTDQLRKTGYTKHFPDYLFEVPNPNKKEGSPSHYLNPAACFHIYQQYQEENFQSGFGSWILAQCARRELKKQESIFRLSNFHMLELVLIGDRNFIDTTLTSVTALLLKTFSSLGIVGTFEVATDAFFLPESRSSLITQKLKQLKKEYAVRYNEHKVALASINRHETYFSKRFSIKVNNRGAETSCVAFGLERLTAYSLLTWGKNKRHWPKELRRD